ncbi:hypothetical protein ACFQV4_14700 [Streptomyces thermocarboxydus]
MAEAAASALGTEDAATVRTFLERARSRRPGTTTRWRSPRSSRTPPPARPCGRPPRPP